jgi:hypothetical protein
VAKVAHARYMARNPERQALYSKTASLKRMAARVALNPMPPVCDLCGKSFEGVPHWDHDHETNKFRGWLHSHCNLMLGCAKDDPDLLRLGATYMETRK